MQTAKASRKQSSLSGKESAQGRDSQESSPTPQFKSISSLALSFLYSPTHIHTWNMCGCPTLWDPIDGSPPGSSVHGIFQARVLEWGRQEYWSGWPGPPPGGLPNDISFGSSTAGGFVTAEPFSNTTVQKHQFYSTQLSSQSNSDIHT